MSELNRKAADTTVPSDGGQGRSKVTALSSFGPFIDGRI
jgi:hypothetical protein